jgi:hypothetical protein
MSTVATPTGSALAAVLVALTACSRPAETRPPPQPEAPQPEQPQPAPPPTEVTEPPAGSTVTDEPARERRHGAVATLTPPPVPPRDDYEVWGDVEGTPVGETFGTGGLGCPRGFEPPPPSYVRGGRRSLVRLRSSAVVDGPAAVAQRLLAGRAATLRACHLEAMEADPTAAGDLRLRLDIGANGGVLAVVVEASGLAIDDCVRATALRWRFPPTDDPATLTAVYELRTEPAPPERPRAPRCRP